jgi:ADP-ribose pyrophosphatase YjhB (NUDIX family)
MKTIGVQALVVREKEILLISHSYGSNAWATVGGGLQYGETPYEAIKREVREETGYETIEPPRLFQVYLNQKKTNDIIILFIVKVAGPMPLSSSLEIKAKKWFPLEEETLQKEEIALATKRRLKEYFNHEPLNDRW